MHRKVVALYYLAVKGGDKDKALTRNEVGKYATAAFGTECYENSVFFLATTSYPTSPRSRYMVHCKYVQGQAPEGYEFIDEEEEYIVASNGRSGSWQPYQPGQSEQQPDNPPQKIPVKRKTKKKSKMQEVIQQDNGGDMEDI